MRISIARFDFVNVGHKLWKSWLMFAYTFTLRLALAQLLRTWVLGDDDWRSGKEHSKHTDIYSASRVVEIDLNVLHLKSMVAFVHKGEDFFIRSASLMRGTRAYSKKIWKHNENNYNS